VGPKSRSAQLVLLKRHRPPCTGPVLTRRAFCCVGPPRVTPSRRPSQSNRHLVRLDSPRPPPSTPVTVRPGAAPVFRVGAVPPLGVTATEYAEAPCGRLPARPLASATARALPLRCCGGCMRGARASKSALAIVRKRTLVRPVDSREASKSLRICRLPGGAPAIVLRTVDQLRVGTSVRVDEKPTLAEAGIAIRVTECRWTCRRKDYEHRRRIWQCGLRAIVPAVAHPQCPVTGNGGGAFLGRFIV
jgi:hypothetical protein